MGPSREFNTMESTKIRLAIEENVVAALKMIEGPAFAARSAPGREPIHQNQRRIFGTMKFLPLAIARTRKSLNRIRRKNKQRAGPERRLRRV